jgi:hypothetical protein
MSDSCDGTTATALPLDGERAPLIAQAFRLEWFTVAWMTIECAVAIRVGTIAHSISLTSFGIDSLIELASAGVLIWRLSVELKHGHSFSENAEHIASKAGFCCSHLPHTLSWPPRGACVRVKAERFQVRV